MGKMRMDDTHVGQDRRRSRRLPVDRAGKVFLRRALRYLPVRALDVSLGGLLVEIKTDRPLLVGEPLEVVLGDGQSAVMGQEDVVSVRIAHVRQLGDGRQRVGLAFTTGQAGSAAAAA
ncbi:MAG: hypothetical protein KatS3mg103_0997 [Phycisphaerales bacterium]|nr:MAG: hypothetical protein KatS3mg103_0997 [Phycisphaerales bacterium]